MVWFPRGSKTPLSLAGVYEPEPSDVKLAAILLGRVAAAHSSDVDPDIIMARTYNVLSTLGHLAGAAEFCGGFDVELSSGMYHLRVILPARQDNTEVS